MNNSSSVNSRCNYSKENLWIRHNYTDNLKETKDIMKIVKYLKESKLLNKGVENEVKEQNGAFLGMLAATLGDSLLGLCYQVKELSELVNDLFKLLKEQLECCLNVASYFN